MKDEFTFKDMKGRKVDPLKLRKSDRFTVIDNKNGDRLGVFNAKDFRRKFL